MRRVESISEMQRLAEGLRLEGRTIALVPTMGALHEGHLNLVRHASGMSDVTVVSIFVNPTQFAPNEDFDSYPRRVEDDIALLDALGVDVAFVPEAAEMYPEGFQTYVEVTKLQRHLCGPFRPGHFRGVATVVLKLFNIVKPHVAVFGEKDYQQLRIIETMVRDLNLDIRIEPHPVEREEDGLAMSSRNGYLDKEGRRRAAALYEALSRVREEFLNGTTDAAALEAVGTEVLRSRGLTQIDYLRICDPRTLETRKRARPGDVVALALRLGGTRLIDNIRL